MKGVTLSPTALGIFKSCPRCFWLDRKARIPRPRGIFPSLPGGMDRVLKTWSDYHRARGLMPPELKESIQGALFPDLNRLNLWRNWRTGLGTRIGGAVVTGALDDLVVEGGLHSPLDFKTKGSAPASSGEEYYQHQLDVYALLLGRNNLPVSGKGYLAYYWPETVKKDDGYHVHPVSLGFGVQVFELTARPERAVKMVEEAIAILARPLEEVLPGLECGQCSYVQRVSQRLSAGVA